MLLFSLNAIAHVSYFLFTRRLKLLYNLNESIWNKRNKLKQVCFGLHLRSGAAVRRAVFPVQCEHWCSVYTAVRSPCNGGSRHVSINNIKLCEYDFLLVYFETLTCIFVKSKIFLGKFIYILFIISVSAVSGPVQWTCNVYLQVTY